MARSPFGTQRTRGYIPWLSIAIPAAGWLTFGLYPSAATLFYSLTRYSGLPGTPLNYCGLCNYRAATTNLLPTVGSSIRITLIYTLGITIIQTALALGLAVLLRRAGRMYNLYRALVFLPGIFSVVIIGAAFTLIFDPINGPAQAIIQQVFGASSAFLGSSTVALPIVMGVAIWSGTGYAMLIFIAGLRRIPADVLEAAALDGAGRWRSFWRVSWPLLAPATTVNVFLAAMSARSGSTPSSSSSPTETSAPRRSACTCSTAPSVRTANSATDRCWPWCSSFSPSSSVADC